MFENHKNKIEQPKFNRAIIELELIQEEDIEFLKFLAAFEEPVELSFWNVFANLGEDGLTNLISKYHLTIQENGEICPIDIPGVDLAHQHLLIANFLLEQWKKRKNNIRNLYS
jgi:hypothetical protein